MKSHQEGTIRGQHLGGVGTCYPGSRRFSRRIEQRIPGREVLDEVPVLRKIDVQLVGEIHDSFRCGTVPNPPQVLDDAFPRTARVDSVLHRLRKLADTPPQNSGWSAQSTSVFSILEMFTWLVPDRSRLIPEELLLSDRHRTIRDPVDFTLPGRALSSRHTPCGTSAPSARGDSTHSSTRCTSALRVLTRSRTRVRYTRRSRPQRAAE